MDCKHVLLAVDGSENSRRAVDYTAAILGCNEGFKIRLLHIERLPDRDLFPDEAGWKASCEEYTETMRRFMEECRRALIDAGMPEDAVTEQYIPSCNRPVAQTDAVRCSQGESISQEILRSMEDGGYGTIVLGRRGLSKAEEFLFGSVSSRIVHHARGCTVWVVS